jgi:hypothetical protein
MAKVNPSETELVPAAPGEWNFVKIHKIKDVSAKAIDLNNGINNAQDKVKTYNRKKDRMGRDEIESIKAYDPLAVKENVISVMNKVMKRVNHKNNKKLKLGKGLDIKKESLEEAVFHMYAYNGRTGEGKRLSARANSHAEVEKHLSTLHKHIKDNNLPMHRVSIERPGGEGRNHSAQVDKDVGVYKRTYHNLDDIHEHVLHESEIQVGDHVHIGLRIRGGAGFRGKVEHIDDHGMAHVKLHSELYKDHPRIVKGHISRCTKEEMEVPAGDLVEEGLKDFTEVIDEVSRKTLGRYIGAAAADRGAARGRKDDATAKKREKGMDMAFDKAFGKSKVKPTESVEVEGEPVSELSSDLLDDYQKKATKSARKLSATGNTGKADKRLNSVNTALDKMFSKERAKKDASNNMQDTSA